MAEARKKLFWALWPLGLRWHLWRHSWGPGLVTQKSGQDDQGESYRQEIPSKSSEKHWKTIQKARKIIKDKSFRGPWPGGVDLSLRCACRGSPAAGPSGLPSLWLFPGLPWPRLPQNFPNGAPGPSWEPSGSPFWLFPGLPVYPCVFEYRFPNYRSL